MPLTLDGNTGVQGNSGAFVAGTAVATTSGTSIDFTSIPSWVKRITISFNGVSTNGSSQIQVQIGAGSVTTSGYISTTSIISGSVFTTSSTNGFVTYSNAASNIVSGQMVLTLVSGNIWVSQHTLKLNSTNTGIGGGDITLGGTLDRVRITTANGTDTFDAGSINILYE
jgi:hypothetical protein